MQVLWSPGQTLKSVEKEIIETAMRFYGNDKNKVADSLKISVRTVQNKINEYEDEKKNTQTR